MTSTREKACLRIAKIEDLMYALLKLMKEASEKLCHKLCMCYKRSIGRWCVNGYVNWNSQMVLPRTWVGVWTWETLHFITWKAMIITFSCSVCSLWLSEISYRPMCGMCLTELSQFVRDFCTSKLHVDDIVRLENNIAEILCKLEQVFLSVFFNVMEHLPVHLPTELKLGSPVQYRWMNDYERYDMIHRNHVSSCVHKWHCNLSDYKFLHYLKGKVGNKARVEPSICYAYLLWRR